MDWFTVIISILIGFFIGRFYPVIKGFNNYLEQQNKLKQNGN